MKIIWYGILILGCTLGFFFGIPPGMIIDASYLQDSGYIHQKALVLFATIYGYLSFLLIIVSIIYGAVSRRVLRRNTLQKIKAEVFDGGSVKIQREKFQQTCELTDDEMKMLYGDSQTQFDYDDYLKGRNYIRNLNKSRLFQIK
jgi:hypothetical protein